MEWVNKICSQNIHKLPTKSTLAVIINDSKPVWGSFLELEIPFLLWVVHVTILFKMNVSKTEHKNKVSHSFFEDLWFLSQEALKFAWVSFPVTEPETNFLNLESGSSENVSLSQTIFT